MTGTPDHHDATTEPRQSGHEQVRYPTNHVLAVLDTREQATDAVAALASGGYLESEIQINTGAATADDVSASPGRGGLAGILIRLAERMGVTDEELETKHRYERALRDNRFVVAVAAPTEERKDRAAKILREHGAHTVTFFGKATIEYITPPGRG